MLSFDHSSWWQSCLFIVNLMSRAGTEVHNNRELYRYENFEEEFTAIKWEASDQSLKAQVGKKRQKQTIHRVGHLVDTQ